MFQYFPPILTGTLSSDPTSPQDDMKSVFSFYIREPTNINPFNPTSMSTPRKSHHVSMPNLPAKPTSMKLHNVSLDTKKTRKSAPLHKSPSLRPFLIRIQSSAGNLENTKDTLSRKEFTKPSKGRRSTTGVEAERTRAARGGVFWLKGCTLGLKRKLSCKPATSDDSVLTKQRAYYFI